MDTPQRTVKTETVGIQKDLFEKQKSNVEKYQDLIIGKRGLRALIKHELITLLSSWVPGALGIFLRSKLYPLLLGGVGRNVSFGTNVVLRHSHKIFIRDNVVVDDNCVLDAKGKDNRGIVIGEGVFIGRNTILSCKNGDILLSDNTNIGFNCEIVSANYVKVGKNVLMAAYTYIIDGDHDFERIDIPIVDQGRHARGIDIEDNVWLGAGVKVLDGVTVGRDSIIGTSAVVTADIPEYSIAAGIPAKILRKRDSST
jgi:acetyltransferase-like isoleucine patch superfamily enzyme